MRILIILAALLSVSFGCLEVDPPAEVDSQVQAAEDDNCFLESVSFHLGVTDCQYVCPDLPIDVGRFKEERAFCEGAVCVEMLPRGGWDWCPED